MTIVISSNYKLVIFMQFSSPNNSNTYNYFEKGIPKDFVNEIEEECSHTNRQNNILNEKISERSWKANRFDQVPRRDLVLSHPCLLHQHLF